MKRKLAVCRKGSQKEWGNLAGKGDYSQMGCGLGEGEAPLARGVEVLLGSPINLEKGEPLLARCMEVSHPHINLGSAGCTHNHFCYNSWCSSNKNKTQGHNGRFWWKSDGLLFSWFMLRWVRVWVFPKTNQPFQILWWKWGRAALSFLFTTTSKIKYTATKQSFSKGLPPTHPCFYSIIQSTEIGWVPTMCLYFGRCGERMRSMTTSNPRSTSLRRLHQRNQIPTAQWIPVVPESSGYWKCKEGCNFEQHVQSWQGTQSILGNKKDQEEWHLLEKEGKSCLSLVVWDTRTMHKSTLPCTGPRTSPSTMGTLCGLTRCTARVWFDFL